MVNEIEKLKADLKALQNARETKAQVMKLKKQIQAEKFGQTKTGKFFNPILAVGEKITRPKTQQQIQQASKKGSKKVKKNVKSVKDVMASFDKAVNQFNY